MEEEKFSDDPEENFRIENEILKLKLKAQYGDAFFMQSNEAMPPEIENQFLKNILDFENNAGNSETTTVFKKIGSPAFVPAARLDKTGLSEALKYITAVMEEKGVFLDINNGPYDDAVIYKFITEELFDHEIDTLPLFGSGWHFIYEEFYPNDKADIEHNTHYFLRHWFARELNEYSTELGYTFITADGKQLGRQEFFIKMKSFFESFTAFNDDGYNINEIKFELQPDGNGLGHAEGMLKYDAVLENNEVLHFEGPYKLYMSREDKWWSVFYFVMPGFKW